MKDEEHTPNQELDYGQFLNWVAQDDWIAKRKKLLRCECSDHHDHDFGEHCPEFMTTLARLESISLQNKNIVFTPLRSADIDEAGSGGVRRLVGTYCGGHQ
jgi:hypothetical protein